MITRCSIGVAGPAPFDTGVGAANADVLVGPMAVTNASNPAMVRRGASENFNFLNIRIPPRALNTDSATCRKCDCRSDFQITYGENDNGRIFQIGCNRVK